MNTYQPSQQQSQSNSSPLSESVLSSGHNTLSQWKGIKWGIFRRILIVFIAIGTFGFLAWFTNTYIYKFFASNQTATISVLKKEIEVGVGEAFTTSFTVNSSQSEDFISGAELILEYDPIYLEYGDGGSSGFVPLENFPYDVIYEENDPTIGKVEIVLVNPSDKEYPAHQLSFVFRVREDLTREQVFGLKNKVHIYLSKDPKFVGQAGGNGVLFEAPTSDTVLSAVSIRGETPSEEAPLLQGNISAKLIIKTRFQGILGEPVGSKGPMMVRVTLHGSSGGSKTTTISFQPGADGIWTGEYSEQNLSENETFSIGLKGPKHLAKYICEAQPSETVGGTYNCNDKKIALIQGDNNLNFSNVILLAGDIPVQDGIIDAVDIAFIRANLGTTTSSVLSRGDLNLDGIVDTQDHSLAIAALGFKYDEK
ncbi:hypothetical protein CO051_02110 [Candidatus Roizmanbacteria bacterium CG_4_9_14_0_2_um_filter_39_13]|uniref:Dockerin domain-containing protein n=2 Tax=Candidatus Roizmaniibacteriota TaxID=1752723 RepID=A0A2M8F1A2_9BACT|nr:MAG: hypothetical protein COY15_05935 [Candidatus Roizmanbacteria bacterium CG_4_10_14_0_2_um_filter_39_12]PJC33055.1 MAG: hypothetical protein CO051_02110 [Candidatus Roizmanbacteria bacterium CG_4_9_14_0_2_um_filter_39_13]PJE61707.1 MAG: hypothetical protein COU87_03125 [Candidatus Roizmanbacteria bacterium CG10_big_fil_rev_8_21_14_0_10_39_12]